MQHAHRWDLTPAQARQLQQALGAHAITRDQLPAEIRYVAGVDAGFKRGGTVTRAAVAVLSFPELELVDSAVVHVPTTFPYVPGLLSFREIPPVLEALRHLTIRPQMILCDGQGQAHPRRLGIATHLGLLLDLPTIGVAKSRLIGEHDELPGAKGSQVPLHHKDEQIGVVLRSRAKVRPLFISVGHRLALATAVGYVQRCLTRYRLPETTRHADRLASSHLLP